MIDVAQEPASHWGQQEHKLVGVEINSNPPQLHLGSKET